MVPDRKSEHAVRATENSVDPPFQVAAQQHLGVTLRTERMTAAFEFPANLLEIVNAAVEHDSDMTVIGKHRLPSCLAQIQNRQPPVPQSCSRPSRDPLRIRATPHQ